jgi:transposase
MAWASIASPHRCVSRGSPSDDPRCADPLKLYVYSYLNTVQSSRRLEREARRNAELMWLTRRLVPVHKTIADFRKDNVLRQEHWHAEGQQISLR